MYFTIFVSEDITDQNLQIMPKKKENPERFDLERFERLYPTEDACVKALEKHLWNGILRSPVDGNTNVIRIKASRDITGTLTTAGPSPSSRGQFLMGAS